MVTVRRITERDAELLREIRLRALSDTPTAFGSTFAGESALATEEWQKRARDRSCSEDGCTFFAFEGEVCCGIIGCFRKADEAATGTIVSMWVSPPARRQGVAGRLMAAIEHWAKGRGMTQLVLDVVSSQAPAIAFMKSAVFASRVKRGRIPTIRACEDCSWLSRCEAGIAKIMECD
jgi:GNAT superfamily N-acetyltransferase